MSAEQALIASSSTEGLGSSCCQPPVLSLRSAGSAAGEPSAEAASTMRSPGLPSSRDSKIGSSRHKNGTGHPGRQPPASAALVPEASGALSRRRSAGVRSALSGYFAAWGR